MDLKRNVETLQKFIGAGSVSVVKLNFEKWNGGGLDVMNQGVLIVGLQKAQDVMLAKFIGVRNVEFKSGAYDDVVLGGLVIELVTSYQWPGVNVRVVSEMEETALSFYSDKVELQF